MNQVEKVLSDWLNHQWNDYYVMYSTAFEGGFRIVEHSSPIINRAFYRLLCNLFPILKEGVCPYAITDDSLTFFPDGVQVTIKPYDDEIHHTQYVKEE